MAHYRKKLRLTFSDQRGEKRNVHISAFLEGLDVEDFAEHMKQSPILDYVIDPRRKYRQLKECQHAYQIETTRHDVLKQPNYK